MSDSQSSPLLNWERLNVESVLLGRGTYFDIARLKREFRVSSFISSSILGAVRSPPIGWRSSVG